MKTKYCPDCDTEKPVSEFCKAKPLKDGTQPYFSYCKDCKAAYIREYRRKNKERDRKKLAETKKRHRKNNRDKYIARRKITLAIKNGWLIPKPCAWCSATPTEAHHESYKQIYEIIWLCYKCHLETHGKKQRIKIVEPGIMIPVT